MKNSKIISSDAGHSERMRSIILSWYGPVTEKAVTAFQMAEYNYDSFIAVDGILGNNTKSKLFQRYNDIVW